ncbi:MAG TPA: signal recognition particle-docking protein FtsY [Acidimicrobiales bacterium]|nr:signal recognition particle-docking protein FtsY [Acidimicrobiales bacterium]
MIDPAMINAASDTVIGLAVGIPVIIVAGGVTLGVRLRRRRTEPDAVAPEATKARPAARTAAPPAETAEPSAEVAPPVQVAKPVEVAEPVEVVEAAEPATYRSRMGKARGLLSGYLGSVRSKSKIDASTWDDLEEALIRADVGVGATDALLDDLRTRVKAGEISGADALIDALKADLVATLSATSAGLAEPRPEASLSDSDDSHENDDSDNGRSVDVWLFVGVNGVGKTTTVGKVASRLAADGNRVLLAAADTFRAAAAEQLETWATRSDADIVRGSEGGDPSSVVFDAVQRAASKGHAVVLADTAGRLHNKVNLVEELKKIRRVADRPPGRVVEVLLVLDATTGQNGLAQAKVFTEAVDVTGVVLTKLDGTAKGGIVVAIQRELGLPVKLVGLGEGVGDLVDFDAAAFVDALF